MARRIFTRGFIDADDQSSLPAIEHNGAGARRRTSLAACDYYRDLFVAIIVAYIFIFQGRLHEKLMKGFVFAFFPSRIIKILIEDDNAARLNPVSQQVKYRSSGGIKNAINMEETDLAIVSL
jgi:hypothetical protein